MLLLSTTTSHTVTGKAIANNFFRVAAVVVCVSIVCQVGLATMLCELHQTHLLDGWPMPGTDDDKKHAFFKQASALRN